MSQIKPLTPTAKKSTRKPRVNFTGEATLELLKLCVEHNTFDQSSQTESWKQIVDNFLQKFPMQIDLKTVKAKVKRLMKDYKANQLKSKTGTEEEDSELKDLLETLVGYEDTGNVNEEVTEALDLFDEDDVLGLLPPSRTSKAQTKTEKTAADMEREKLLNEAPGPSGGRGKPKVISIDDQMILEKQKNERALEEKRMDMKAEKRKREFDIEQQKIDMEKERIKILAEENRRRDDLQLQQLEFQKTMCEVWKSIVKK